MEANGINALAHSGTIRTPKVVHQLEGEGLQLLLLEWIPSEAPQPVFWEMMGKQLAALHQNTSTCFGWPIDNYMGSVPQGNKMQDSWPAFYQHERLEPMVRRCYDKGLMTPSILTGLEMLYQRLPEIFPTGTAASLVHGDLWSGNFLCTTGQQPVLIDPAVHYGHPAVDLGMTTLFGGFAPEFYRAYRYHAKPESNYREQWKISTLYPLLVHLYLFGPSYRPAIEKLLQEFN
jgi:protein-ribulosamine 3-kinase